MYASAKCVIIISGNDLSFIENHIIIQAHCQLDHYEILLTCFNQNFFFQENTLKLFQTLFSEMFHSSYRSH